jgi:beta-galactosidase
VKELERWESVDLPHTVRVEPYTSSSKNYQGPATYVKRFPSQPEWKGKKVTLEFEGVMGVSDVWVNGKHLTAKQAQATGNNTNYGGFLPFVVDISDALTFDGSDNVVTVAADNSDNPVVPPGKPQKNLDFSYFGGIYRDVWLHVTNPVHITQAIEEDIPGGGGLVIDYPMVTKESATVSVKTHLRNEGDQETKVTVKQQIKDPGNTVVGETVSAPVTLPAKGSQTVEASIQIANPKLWSLESPNMQTLVTTVYANGVPVDALETRIGIRTIRITKEKGIEINGEPAGILSGVNRHQEYAYIGYAMPDSLHKRDAIKFKEAGINAVRTGHYPHDRAFIEACDELGLLVFQPVPGWQWYVPDPAFRTRISQNIQQMIRRDRNSPSILAYEVSLNESHPENEEEFNQTSVDVAKAEKQGVIYSLGSGCNVWDSQTGVMGSFGREYGDYMWAQSGDFKGSGRTERSPDFFYPGGEARMVKQARERMWEGGGQGHFLGMLSAYSKNPLSLGGAQWTGIDHNRGYSANGAACGMLDLYRIPKFIYHLYASQRSAEKAPTIFIASNWTEKVPVFDKVTTLDFSLGTDALRNIDVYSNAAKVRLSVIQNGGVKWTKTQEPSVFTANNISTSVMKAPPFLFVDVPYHKGTLKAEGLDASGKVIAEHSVTTAGEPARIVLKADSEGIDLVADGSDIISVQAYVTDAEGNVCSTASNEITFTAKNGKIIGDGDKRVGSNPVKAAAGIIVVPVQSTPTPGPVEISASSPGLQSGTLAIEAKSMTQKAVPYTPIAQGELLDQGSTFLVNKEKMAAGQVVTGNVEVGDTNYAQSITLEKPSAQADYYLNKAYERLVGKVGISSADPQSNGRAVLFKIYCDGVLKYASKPIAFGETADVEINVGGVDELTLAAVDAKDAENSGSASFLSPFIEEGKSEGIEESAIRQNLAPAMSPWTQDFKKGNPVWQVDLGRKYDVRNALLKVQYDSMKYSYEIWISPDNTKWTRQISNEKTAHNNEVADTFTAKDVRYVKVVFNDVIPVGIDWGKAASITGFEIYRDLGVDSAREFLLKGLTVEGKDLVFSPSVDSYGIEQKGLKSQVTLRALPYDPQAVVKINGNPVNNPPATSHMMEATPVTLDLEAGTNKVEIAVTNARGTGTKIYTLNIESDGGNSFNAMECFVLNQNGANGWRYQYQDIKTGEIKDITLPMKFVGPGNPVWGSTSRPWEFSGPMTMHPGAGTVNAVRTFKSPKAGRAVINATARLASGNSGSVLLRVYKNDTQIHPASGNGTLLVSGANQIATIESLPVDLDPGDEIRFVVDPNGPSGGDATQWDTTVSFEPADTSKADSLEITGNPALSGFSDETLTAQFFPVAKKGGETIKGAEAKFSLSPELKGVAIDRFGKLTVAPGVSDVTFQIHAVLKGNPRVKAETSVSVKRQLPPGAVKAAYENVNPKIQVTEAWQGLNAKGWLDTRLKIKAMEDCDVLVAVAKVLDVDNKIDTTIDDSKILRLKANEEVEAFLTAKWDNLKPIDVTGQKIMPQARFIIENTKTPAPTLKDGKLAMP